MVYNGEEVKEMTLYDIYELMNECKECKGVEEVMELFSENVEDVSRKEAEIVFENSGNDIMTFNEGAVSVSDRVIMCPDCNNNAASKILGNPYEIISGIEEAALVCCNCLRHFRLCDIRG